MILEKSMYPEEVKKSALQHGGYETPELNDQLYLHYKGYQRIENLEPYVNVKALWLDSNGLEKIENLNKLHLLRCLYLQRNLLTKIENLECLQNLVTLDLSENRISHLEGLSCLRNLTTINVSKNFLFDTKSIAHLQYCGSLSSIDLSNNGLKDEDAIQIFAKMAKLTSLNMKGNPMITDVKYFRKKMIATIQSLQYLDKPIFDIERSAVEAWVSGGSSEEQKVRKFLQNKKRSDEQKSLEDFREWQAEVRRKKLKEIETIKEKGLSREQQINKDYIEKVKKERLNAAAQEGERERQIFALPRKDNQCLNTLENPVDIKSEIHESQDTTVLKDSSKNQIGNNLIQDSAMKQKIHALPSKSIESKEPNNEVVVADSDRDSKIEEGRDEITKKTSNEIVSYKTEVNGGHQKMRAESNDIRIGNYVQNGEGRNENTIKSSLHVIESNEGSQKISSKSNQIRTESVPLKNILLTSQNKLLESSCSEKDVPNEKQCAEMKKATKNTPMNSLVCSDEERHQLVIDSLSMYRSKKIKNDDQLWNDKQEKCIKKDSSSNVDNWNVETDACLSKYVFEFTPDSCRLRWSELDSIVESKHKDLALNKKNKTFEEVQSRAFREPNRYLTAPKVLPSIDDFTDDDSEDSLIFDENESLTLD